MIKLSNMRNKVQFLKSTVAMDATGNRISTYASYCVRWAYINKQSGSETYESGKTSEQETLKFIVRFDNITRLITPGNYRISFSGKTYNIISVDNYMMKNESLTIIAEEI